MSRRQYTPLIALVVCVVLAQFFGVAEVAFAQGAPAAPIIPQGVDTAIASIVTKMITGINMMTWVIFVFLNYLLDPLYIFDLGPQGQEGALMQMLNNIWQLSRDLMNVLFAVLLIVAAIYTIITAKKEFISQHAPKFLMAVILVNFSWFIPRVLFDVANVATA